MLSHERVVILDGACKTFVRWTSKIFPSVQFAIETFQSGNENEEGGGNRAAIWAIYGYSVITQKRRSTRELLRAPGLPAR